MIPARVCLTAAFLMTSTGAAFAEVVFWGQANLAVGQGRVSNRVGNGESISDEVTFSRDVFGRIGADFGAFGAELDLSHSRQEVPPSDSAFEFGRFVSLRANYDLSDTWTLGAVAGKGQSQPFDDQRANVTFRALEGAYLAGPSAFGLQLGTFQSDDEDTFHDGRFLRLSALHLLANGAALEGEIGLFKGSQETGSEFAMNATTWRVSYSRQIGSNPFAFSIGLDGGRYSNGSDESDNGSYDEVRVMVGLTAWFGDRDFASAKRRAIFGQPEFGRIVSAGSNLD